MGNQAVSNSHNDHQRHKTTKLSKILKSKLANTVKTPETKDNFFIEHIQNNKRNDNFIDVNALDQRRVVFISLIGLYQTWQLMPSVALYTALFLLPLKRKWIFNPSKYADELESNLISQISIFSDYQDTQKFIRLLKWKDSQKLIFWMLDEYKPSNNSTRHDLVDPFWHYFSQQLCKLYDPITKNKYEPIHLDSKWWENNSKFTPKYGTKTSSILSELYFLTMKFKTIQEIIYRSNPDSLYPVKSYTNGAVSMTQLTQLKQLSDYAFDDEENWFVCEDIDQYLQHTDQDI